MRQRARRQPRPDSGVLPGATRTSTAASASIPLTLMRQADVQTLQRSGGNRVARSAAAGAVQRLTVGAAGDQHEHEADQVARQVVQHIRSNAGDSGAAAQRMDLPEEEEMLMAKHEHGSGSPEVGMAGGSVSASTAGAISAASGGRPLGGRIRSQMEGAFGADFSSVRVHQGPDAADLNQRLSAKAFTTGADIFMGPTASPPTSEAGQELLAHELTHVIQQGAARTFDR